MIPARILLLSDGRPGHFRLSEGVVAAIARLRPVTVHRIETRRPRWLGTPLALATNAGIAPEVILRRVYGLTPSTVPPAELVVSAGAETLAANIALARLGAASNIFYGSLRHFRACDFTLALTSYRRASMPANQIVTLKPSGFDPDTLADGPTDARARPIALVLGGSAPGCVWSDRDWDRLLRLIEADADIGPDPTAGTRWVVANSRRTPDWVSDAFRDAASRHPTCVRFLDVRQPGATSLPSVLADARLVVVTADSSSMVSEAIWSRRPVAAVMPAGGALSADETAYRTWLSDQGWVAGIAGADLTPTLLDDLAARITPLTTNPQAALAELIRTHIPSLFPGGAPVV